MRELLAHGADVNIKGIHISWTPLTLASHASHLAVVRLLCDAPEIDLSARDNNINLTGLGLALRHIHAEVVPE